jgi:hypothetical protein
MKVYNSGIDDVRVHRLWEQMMLSGDIKNFPPSFCSLTTFLNTMQPSTTLLFEEDDSGIWFAMWLERSMWDFGYVGFWGREDKRQHGKEGMRAIKLALHHFFTKVSMIVVFTVVPKLAAEYMRFGCESRGTLPGVAFGKDAFLLTLTRDQFADLNTVAAAQEQANE